MHPLRGNVLSAVHCRTGLWQRLSKHIVFFTVRFLRIFVFVCKIICFFARLSASNILNIC